MTKKDYIKIALVLRDQKPSEVDHDYHWYRMVIAIANMLKRDNDRFDYSRFEKACGVED